MEKKDLVENGLDSLVERCDSQLNILSEMEDSIEALKAIQEDKREKELAIAEGIQLLRNLIEGMPE